MTSLPPPQFLFLSINEMCNLRCGHCDYWTVKKPTLSDTSLTRQLEIVSEFAELAPGAAVVICGGEPMLDPATYFSVCRTARDLGLRTLSVTNGTLIVSPEDARRVVTEGPDEVSVSLDSPDPEVHDAHRGQKGAFEISTQAVRLLLEQRKQTGNKIKIYVMGLLTSSSAKRLPAFYELVLGTLMADKLKLNALQPSFLNVTNPSGRTRDPFFETESSVDVARLVLDLVECNRRWNLRLNPKWIEQIASYFRVLGRAKNLDRGWASGLVTDAVICNSAQRNVMVDVRSHASLCFSNQFPNQKLEKRGDLAAFWNAGAARAQMASCRAPCGISHSVRREHATLRVLP